jgi:hypothetical protein
MYCVPTRRKEVIGAPFTVSVAWGSKFDPHTVRIEEFALAATPLMTGNTGAEAMVKTFVTLLPSGFVTLTSPPLPKGGWNTMNWLPPCQEGIGVVFVPIVTFAPVWKPDPTIV